MAAIPTETVWADKPFSLVPTPSKRFPNETHSYVDVATEMANIHNVILRGLNSIIQQAPYVPGIENPAYKSQDVADLLFFVRCWVELITHHHGLEEKFIFPEIEKFAGQPGLMEDAVHQHALFHDGMARLLGYATNTTPDKYRWLGDGGMKHIIDSFSEALVDHLYAEIDVLLGLGHLDSIGLRKLWDRCEEHIKKDSPFGSMAYTIVPVVLGCADKTYEGGNSFPAAPKVLPYLVKYWYTRNTGAFRFSPCDLFSRPRPLLFGPVAAAES